MESEEQRPRIWFQPLIEWALESRRAAVACPNGMNPTDSPLCGHSGAGTRHQRSGGPEHGRDTHPAAATGETLADLYEPGPE